MILKMSQNDELKKVIDYVESSIHEGLEESEFINEFRKIIENYIKERL